MSCLGIAGSGQGSERSSGGKIIALGTDDYISYITLVIFRYAVMVGIMVSVRVMVIVMVNVRVMVRVNPNHNHNDNSTAKDDQYAHLECLGLSVAFA